MIKLVLVVRNDLNMRKGKIGAQTGHAVQESILDRSSGTPVLRTTPEVLEWLAASYPKIVLKADSEVELMSILEQAREAGLYTHLVVDNGTTEFHGVKTPTVVAIGPAPAELINVITGHLKPM